MDLRDNTIQTHIHAWLVRSLRIPQVTTATHRDTVRHNAMPPHNTIATPGQAYSYATRTVHVVARCRQL